MILDFHFEFPADGIVHPVAFFWADLGCFQNPESSIRGPLEGEL
jgi:hypothetical protein